MSITIGIGKNLKITSSPTFRLELEVQEYIAGLTAELSNEQILRLNDFVLCLKNGLGISALSDAFDCIYILAGETQESSLRNLVRRDFDCTLVNAPTWTQYEGFTGNGINQYIRTNFIASVDALQFSLNAGAYGVYSRTSISEVSWAFGALEAAGTKYTYMSPIYSTNRFYFLNNSGANVFVNNVIGAGMFISSRISATNIYGYINNVQTVLKVDNATLLNTVQYFILAINNNGVPFGYSTNQISFVFVGKTLSSPEVTILTNCFEAYMDANGKGVIP